MKHLQVIAALLAPLLVISSALSQTGNREVHDQATNHAEIATARSRYVQADLQTEDVAGRPSGGEAYAQSRRPGPRPPMRPRLGYPQRTYPPRWGSGYPRHAAIGALVGFGLGAAFGAKANTDRHPGVGTRAALLFGTFGAMIGAVVGNGIGPVHSRKVARSPTVVSEATADANSSPHRNLWRSLLIQRLEGSRPAGRLRSSRLRGDRH